MKKVLVIGAGTMGTVHANAYAQMESVELIGIVDIREQKGRNLAFETGTNSFTSFERAVEEYKEIDVIDICIPTYLHKEYVMKAAQIVSSVICEKPLARTLEDAKSMIDFCKKQNVQLFVGHVVRFFPEYIRIKQLIEQGEIGKPVVIRTSRGGPFPNAWENWYGDYNKSGGLLLDLLIHDFDFLRFCFGEVDHVYCESLPIESMRSLSIDYSLVTLRFKSGQIAHLEGTWARDQFSTSVEVSGTEGIIHYDGEEISPLKLLHRSDDHASSIGVAVPESPMKKNPYHIELEHYIHCIESGEQAVVTPYDGYKAIQIAAAARKSSLIHEPILIKE